DFWRAAGPKQWFGSSAVFDAEIALRFGALHQDASERMLDSWRETPIGTLALVLMLDQFTRNLRRGSPLAFANDGAAQEIAAEGIQRGHDLEVTADLQPFLYLPFEHSEDLAAQDRSVDLAQRYQDRTGDAEPLKWAAHHRDIIRRFGRFPHRNGILGRSSTAAERAFLADGGFGG
ncbi:MAG TPA: DUF924 family protein, partial [Sphingomicrobium sp.]